MKNNDSEYRKAISKKKKTRNQYWEDARFGKINHEQAQRDSSIFGDAKVTVISYGSGHAI